ncbi:MAG: hypothetical protein ACE5FJ_12480, partial [Gemmatimonadales bacterium]
REGASIRALTVLRSDHLTLYSIYAEAVNCFGTVEVIHGMPRHAFSEELEEWAVRRGVLVKALEDISLGMASVYRSLELELPEKLPRPTSKVHNRFVDHLAEVMPFDLAVDGELSNGQRVRVSKTSTCDRWGAVCGTVSLFAGDDGEVRAAIEGSNIPLELIQRYAVGGPPKVEYLPRGKRGPLMLSHVREYHGYEVERSREVIEGPFDDTRQPEVVRCLAEALLAGSTDHRAQREIVRAANRIGDYYNRSRGELSRATHENMLRDLTKQLSRIRTYADFLSAPVVLKVSNFVAAEARMALDALPSYLEVGGRRAPLVYELGGDRAWGRHVLKPKQAAQLEPNELERLDRPVRFTVVRGSRREIHASSLGGLHKLLRKLELRDQDRRRGGRHRRGRGRRR